MDSWRIFGLDMNENPKYGQEAAGSTTFEDSLKSFQIQIFLPWLEVEGM